MFSVSGVDVVWDCVTLHVYSHQEEHVALDVYACMPRESGSGNLYMNTEQLRHWHSWWQAHKGDAPKDGAAHSGLRPCQCSQGLCRVRAVDPVHCFGVPFEEEDQGTASCSPPCGKHVVTVYTAESLHLALHILKLRLQINSLLKA